MAERGAALRLAAEALAEARDRPLSRKAALFAALAIDRTAEALFDRHSGGDPLAFRADLAARSEALALVFALAEGRPGGPELVLSGVTLPAEAYLALREADYMVGLYTGGRVERVLIRAADGRAREALPVLEEALSALQS